MKVKFLRKLMVANLIVFVMDNRNCNRNGGGGGGDSENLTDFDRFWQLT